MNWPTADKHARGQRPVLARIIRNDSAQYDPQSFGEAEPERKKRSKSNSEVPPAGAVDLNKVLPAIPDELKQLIVHGCDPKDPKRYPSRSEPFWRAICELVRLGVEDATILGIVLDRRFKISDHVLDQANPEKYARRQLAKAHDEVDADDGSDENAALLSELNEKYCVVRAGGKTKVLTFEIEAGRKIGKHPA